ncbi:hypothetical protein ONS96_006466 [Cadophora gregata f. sp. sojae]|nr:hypothetical protein ONS96_006466 [Cadophora gregata f. sp. sojae]
MTMNSHHGKNKEVSQEPDVLIIGSGPIGAVYVRKLIDADKDIKILMVDMGEQGTRLIGDHKKNNIVVQKEISRFTSTIQGAWSLLSVPVNSSSTSFDSVISSVHENPEQSPYDNLPAAPAIREVGGMGSYWTCSTPEQHPIVERSDIFSDEEWQTLYDDSKALLHTTDTAFNHSVRHNLVKSTLCQANKNRQFVSMPLACQRSARNPDYVEWSSTATILGALADPRYAGGNFELKAQHCCKRLHIDATSRRVIAAELVNLLTNETVLIKAKKYVICAGAVLTTGILFNSDIRPDKGYPALGRYMTEQIVSFCQVVLKRSLIERTWDDPRCTEHFRHFPNDPLHIPFDDPDPQVTSPLSEEHPWHTQIHRDAFNYGNVPSGIDQRLIVDLRFFSYVKPVYENYVEFSSKINDKFGMPQVELLSIFISSISYAALRISFVNRIVANVPLSY